jgi:hypothetical protein
MIYYTQFLGNVNTQNEKIRNFFQQTQSSYFLQGQNIFPWNILSWSCFPLSFCCIMEAALPPGAGALGKDREKRGIQMRMEQEKLAKWLIELDDLTNQISDEINLLKAVCTAMGMDGISADAFTDGLFALTDHLNQLNLRMSQIMRQVREQS